MQTDGTMKVTEVQISTSTSADHSVAVTAVVLTLLLAGGYGFITWYAVSNLDLPRGLVTEWEWPWVLASVLCGAAAILALHRGCRRISLGLAACAIAGPFAVVYDFLTSLSGPFAG